MKKLIIIFLFISSFAYGQECREQTAMLKYCDSLFSKSTISAKMKKTARALIAPYLVAIPVTPVAAPIDLSSLVISDNMTISLERGKTYSGTLNLSGRNITIQATGTGSNPVVNGGTQLKQWVKVSGNIWAAPCVIKPSSVIINGKKKAIGKSPNEGQYYVTRSVSGIYLYDKNQPQTDWAGAEINIHARNWVRKTQRIAAYSNGRYTMASTFPYGSGFLDTMAYQQYVLINHINCLDREGEWAYNGTQLLYYTLGNPNDSIVHANSSNISLPTGSMVKDIDFILAGITISGNNTTIEGCNFYGSEVGVKISNIYNTKILNCTFESLSNKAIMISRSSNVTIDKCTFRNININLGEFEIYNDGSGVDITAEWINGTNNYVGCDSTVITNCIFENLGSAAIRVNRSNNTYIRDNFVKDACMLISDYGAIYFVNCGNSDESWVRYKDGITWWDRQYWNYYKPFVGNFIQGNFVDMRNSQASLLNRTCANDKKNSLYCVYGDNRSSQFTISGNRLQGGEAALFLHWCEKYKVTDNMCIGNDIASFYLTGNRDTTATISGNTFIGLGTADAVSCYSNLVNHTWTNNSFYSESGNLLKWWRYSPAAGFYLKTIPQLDNIGFINNSKIAIFNGYLKQ